MRVPQMLTTLLITGTLLFSCKKEDKPDTRQDAVSADVIEKVQALGFRTEGIRKTTGGYIVENDIILTDEQINTPRPSPSLVIARSEQYRTTNLVTGLPRVINITLTSLPASYTAAVDAAIARYNALGLRLTFQRVATGGDINIVGLTMPSGVWGASGFPDAAGNPFNQVQLNTSAGGMGTNPNLNFATSVIAHELGHCIGFRHTDFFNRSYSGCFVGVGAPNDEGAGTVGAIHIPGTPTAEDPNSWMLACIGSTDNRPFNDNDQVALQFLYGTPYASYSFVSHHACNGIFANYGLVNGQAGDVVVLRLSFSGYISWNGTNNGTGAAISVSAAGQSNSASTPHYTTSTGFSTSCDITFTMPSTAVTVNTTAVIHNSSVNSAAGATLQVISVNGVTNGNQWPACYGNSGGWW